MTRRNPRYDNRPTYPAGRTYVILLMCGHRIFTGRLHPEQVKVGRVLYCGECRANAELLTYRKVGE